MSVLLVQEKQMEQELLLIMMMIMIYCNIGISPEEVLGCDNIDACDDSFDPLATDDDGSCLFFDDCGVCDGNNDCAIFIQDEIQITIDETLVSDQSSNSNFL